MEKWSKLPTDLLFLISDQLGVSDLLCFGAVCRSWQSVVGERRRLRLSSHLQIPWLWFDTQTNFRHKAVKFDRLTADCRFYSIKHRQQRPVQEETTCIGSGYGWLVLTYNKTAKICLLNPITGRQIQLPHLSTYFDRLRVIREQGADLNEIGPLYYYGDFEVSRFIWKAILTSPPDGDGDCNGNGGGDCIVILQPFTLSRLVYARPGDKTWTVTAVVNHGCLDLICHNGQIYTTTLKEGIVSWDFSGPSELKPTIVIKPKPGSPRTLHPPWLVSSPWGDLLYVITHNNVDKEIRMEVYKADFEKQDLVEVVSLGQHAIFRVPHSSMCLPMIDLPHLQRDCIYFKSDYTDSVLGRPQNREVCIYHLEDGTMHFSKLFGELMILESSRMTWFLPSLA